MAKRVKERKGKAAAFGRRADIPEEFKWDLSGLYSDDEAWEKDFSLLSGLMEPLLALRGRLGESAATLDLALRLDDGLSRAIERLHAYAHLRSDEDTTDCRYQALDGRIRKKHAELAAALSWMRPEILALPEDRIAAFLAAPALSEMRRVLEIILRDRPHTLGPAEEKLLAMAAEPLSAAAGAFRMLNDADLRFPEVEDESGKKTELTHGNYLRFLQSPEREVRRRAFAAMYGTYKGVRNAMAGLLGGQVSRQVFLARARGFPSARSAALHDDQVDGEVYDSLVSAVRSALPDFFAYVSLRRRVLGLEKLDMYDQYAPLVAEVQEELPFSLAWRWVTQSLKPLGEQYCAAAGRALSERWMDVYETPGKRSGAYSSGCHDSLPFILLNHQDNLDSAFTLAHELGHSMHSLFSWRNQPHQYSGYRIFVAEVASNVNEALLCHHLLGIKKDAAWRAHLLNHRCDGFKGSVFRQTMFAEFEYLLHGLCEQGEALTADGISERYYGLNFDYYGPEVAPDRLIGLEWARIPHFYYNFYVYKYATGFAAAEALCRRILEGRAGAVDSYLRFLKAGSSGDPLDLLADAGVDLRRPEVIREALSGFRETVEELSGLLVRG